MNKIDGLKFLHKYFPDITLNSLYVDDLNLISVDELRNIRVNPNKYWRIRSACRIGRELALPMGSVNTDEEAIEFLYVQKRKNSSLSFILHCIDDSYLFPEFTGTLAVYNNDVNCITIELQKTPRSLMEKMDSGVRPRDWPVCVNFTYKYLHLFPAVHVYDSINFDFIKYPISKLYNIGCNIFEIYDHNHWYTESYTRFNIYADGSVILNDHRTTDSFF